MGGRVLQILMHCLPTKENKLRYKHAYQLTKIINENPELYHIEITDEEREIFRKAIENDEKRRRETPPNDPSERREKFYYRLEKWLQRNWDKGLQDNLSTEEKIAILKDNGYDTIESHI